MFFDFNQGISTEQNLLGQTDGKQTDSEDHLGEAKTKIAGGNSFRNGSCSLVII